MSHVILKSTRVAALASNKLKTLHPWDISDLATLELCNLLLLATQEAEEVHISLEDLKALT